MFDAAVLDLAERVLGACRRERLMLVAAESCTGGLVAGALTSIPGSSDVVDRAWVTYSYAAKTELLGVPRALIERHGAVSEEVARAMAQGALAGVERRVAIAVTGVAGPGSDSHAKPAGLVHFAAARGQRMLHRAQRYGDVGRDRVRLQSVRDALVLLLDLVETRQA